MSKTIENPAASGPRSLLSRLSDRRLARRLKPILCLDDFEAAARRTLPRPLFGYVAGAAETNASLDDNRAAFAELGFLPQILSDVSKRNQSRTLLGVDHASPFGIAPMGLAAMMAYRGDIVLAEAAREAGIPMVLSGASLIPLEEVSEAAPDSWFQAYLPGDFDRIDALVERALAAGYETLVLTVDVPTSPNRENNVRNGFSTPLKPGLRLGYDGAVRPGWTFGTLARTLSRHGMPHFENGDAFRGAPIFSKNAARNFDRRDELGWVHLERMRARWKGTLVVKGILRVADAVRAVECGADGIIVSNHGGRQLDGAIAPLRVLPEIVEAIGGRTAVMLDGGVRRGTDVLKAIALGADFVFVGRPLLYAAAVGGAAGVAHAIALLSSEIGRDMALLGINTLDELDGSFLRRLDAGWSPLAAPRNERDDRQRQPGEDQERTA